MICDPLTKAGNDQFSDRLQSTMTTGLLDLEPSPSSQLKKLKTQKARMAKSMAKLEAKDADQVPASTDHDVDAWQ